MTDAEIAGALARVDALRARLAKAPRDHDGELDTIWMLLTGDLIWFMAAGFCFLEMGSLRAKNAHNVLAKNLIVPVVALICWYVTGYALAFGITDPPSKFIGGRYFVMQGFWDDKARLRKWFFQLALADVASSIVSGGVAERMTMFGFCIHTVAMTAFIYPVVVYWAWSGAGWLSFEEVAGQRRTSVVGPGYLDWAGSGVIHLVGGVAALCGAVAAGPRLGRFAGGRADEEFAPHSVPFTVLGTFILWLGWFGLNPGCTLSMHSEEVAFKAAIATCNCSLAPAAGGLVAWLLRRYVLRPYHYDVPALCNGILIGLVAISAGSGFVKMWEAIVIGGVAGLLYCLSCIALPCLRVDDPIGAVSVHLVGGLWGVLAMGFFGNPEDGLGGNGVFYGGDQLKVQALGCACLIGWSGALSLAIFVPLRLLGLLRLSDDVQHCGADLAHHSPPRDYTRSRLRRQNTPHPGGGGMFRRPLPVVTEEESGDLRELAKDDPEVAAALVEDPGPPAPAAAAEATEAGDAFLDSLPPKGSGVSVVVPL